MLTGYEPLRDSDRITPDDVPTELTGAPPERIEGDLPFTLPPGGLDLMALERDVIVATLRMLSGNQSAAARYLRIPRHVLVYRLEKFGIDPSDFAPR